MKIRDLFKKKRYSQWIPLGNYNFDSTDFVVFARKNLVNGMIQFRTVRASSKVYSNWLYMPHDLIDTKEAWEKLMKL